MIPDYLYHYYACEQKPFRNLSDLPLDEAEAVLEVIRQRRKGFASQRKADYLQIRSQLNGQKVLGAHMLEICPTIAEGQVNLEVHPLGIGGKADPARLVFNSQTGSAINAALMDMGNRFRLLVHDVDVVPPDAPLPKLPVARSLWIPRPNFKDGIAAWIYAGGAHHTGFSLSLTAEHINDFAEMAGIEFLHIGADTQIPAFKNELRWNDAYYLLTQRI